MSDHTETLAQRDARINAWLSGVSPGDIVTVRLNSTDILTGKVYEAPDDTQRAALYVYTTLLRHGNGYPGGSFEPVTEPVSDHTDTIDTAQAVAAEVWKWLNEFDSPWSPGDSTVGVFAFRMADIVAASVAAARAERDEWWFAALATCVCECDETVHYNVCSTDGCSCVKDRDGAELAAARLALIEGADQ